MDDTDEYLIKEYLSGDENSFKLLIDRYTSPIYNFTTRFVGSSNSSDLVQDIFIKVWKNIKNFDISKSGFKTWIFTITRNTIIDFLRKKKSVVFTDLDTDENLFEDTLVSDGTLQDDEVIKLQDVNLLNSMLEKLPDKYKEVLILHYQEDMTFIEISNVLNRPMNSVKSDHYRAIKLLRELIAPKL